MREGAKGGGARGRCPARFRRGGPRDAASLPLRVGPSHLGSAWRPGLCSAPPAPGHPRGSQAPRPLGRHPSAQTCGWERAGVPVPHTRVSAPPAQPLPGPSAAPAPRALRPPPHNQTTPSTSRGRGRPPFPTITSTDSAPHPPGTRANGSSPGPGPTCTAQPSLEVGAGKSSALLCLSLAFPAYIVSTIG